ncbi:MAG: hypothetical protein IJ525_06320 [Alphaproteobacteria bacterium]|nr:hypothetical protein [Alphaproteobacteria bacterium]
MKKYLFLLLLSALLPNYAKADEVSDYWESDTLLSPNLGHLSQKPKNAIAEKGKENGVDLNSVMDAYVPSPVNVIEAQHGSNKDIQYMLDNYSLPELARYAMNINKRAIKEAKIRNTTPPPKLTREILTDREKIGEYLRSLYKFEY